MKKLLFALLTLSIAPAHADEIFKCLQKSGKTIYQSEPCERAEKQQAIEVPTTDPKKMAEEEAKLKAWEKDFATREAERARAEKEQQYERERQATLEAIRQNAEAQRQAARQAEEQQRQSREYIYPYPYYFPYQSYHPVFPSLQPYEQPRHHHGDSGRTLSQHPQQLPQVQPPAPNGIKLHKEDNVGLEQKTPGFK